MPADGWYIRSIASLALACYAAAGAKKMAKIMISLPQDFLKKVDRAAKAQRRSRSELIREALRTLLSGSQGARRSWTEALAPLKELELQWIGQWNSTDIVRYYRETRYGREDRR
jgi:Arc/MetJ-type ribon-helix-helix transcriptional regulator